jgi:hypothetical protein
VSPATVEGAVLGAAVAAAGGIGGIVLIRWGLGKDQKKFFAALSAAILGRLLLYGAALVVVALRTTIDLTATAASLLAVYVLFQVVEVRFAVRGLSKGRG